MKSMQIDLKMARDKRITPLNDAMRDGREEFYLLSGGK